MHVYYLPLEPYQERYTLQLKDWTESAFKRNNVQWTTIEPFDTDAGEGSLIRNIGPLDYWRRCKWSLKQIDALITILQTADVKETDCIYFQDMFHPGIEALFYIFAQRPVKPKIFVQNCAQSMDIYDFVYPMIDWMRDYEKMCDGFVTGTFVASTIHEELMRVSEFKGPIHVTGLPFDREEVVNRLRSYGIEPKAWGEKSNKVVFTSRFDAEKQPHWFMDIVLECKSSSDPILSNLEFCILSGGTFRSSDESAVERARAYHEQGILTIKEKLSKEEYYRELNDAKVQINTALQDFVSNTLNEASAFKTKSLLPAFRSFPESCNNSRHMMYLPWSKHDCISKLREQINSPYHPDFNYPSEYNSKTLDRVIEVMRG